jgi:dephospho-CoA kinase
MGKSTTARLFAEAGVPVWDADAAVHRIYGRGGSGAEVIGAIVPDATHAGEVDRDVLRAAVVADPSLLPRIEAAVHPLVALDREAFLNRVRDAPLVVLDIPLLFETRGEAAVDAVVVVTAPPDVQRERVMARPGMTEAAFARILDRQMPDAVKRARADFVIDTSSGLEAARAAVRDIVADIERRRHA